MQGNTIKLLIVIFFILCGIVVFPSLQTKFFSSHKSSEVFVAGFTADTTKQISIQDTTVKLILQNDNNTWKVATYAASSDKMTSLFTTLANIKIGSVVSTNPQNITQYGLSSESAILLTLEKTGEKRSFMIGKATLTGNSFYMKKDDTANVYVAEGSLRDILSTKISDWRDRAVIRISSDQMQKVEVTGASSFSLEKSTDNAWELIIAGNKKQIADTEAQQFVQGLSTLTASDFYSEQEASIKQSSSSKRTITIRNKEGKIIAELTVIPDEAYYLVTAQGKSDFYKVAGYNVDDLLKLSEIK